MQSARVMDERIVTGDRYGIETVADLTAPLASTRATCTVARLTL